MALVRIPTPLRPLARGEAEIQVAAATVGEALGAVVTRHPALRRHLFAEDGALREYVNAFRNERDIRELEGVATALDPDDDVILLPSIAGG